MPCRLKKTFLCHTINWTGKSRKKLKNGDDMIKLFTDTSANLTNEIINLYGIKIIPFGYSVNGKKIEYNVNSDFDGKYFYDSMRNGADVKTSMINSTLIYESLEEELKNGSDVIYITMSGGISGTAHAAVMAAEELREIYTDRKIAIINSLAASLGEGLQVIKIAKLLESGADFETVKEKAEELTEKICQYFTVDDLEYLKRGGRISRLASAVGTVLKIKPVLRGDDEGKIVMCAKIRGRNNALSSLADYYEELCSDKSEDIGIAHADDEADAEYLKELLAEKGFKGNCLTVCFEPVTGAHVGPGTVALFFFK